MGALAIPVHHVSPAKWKKTLGLNSDAETSRARAIEAWPDQAELFARKLDHSRAEAALLGMYGLGRWPMSAGNTTRRCRPKKYQ
jgi:crossover junction endodeoxyribonuclease RuvC